MAGDREIEIKLRVIAAEAESLADDVRNGRLWEGDLQKRLSTIREALDAASRMARH